MVRARFGHLSYGKSEIIILAVPVKESKQSRTVKIVTDKERDDVRISSWGSGRSTGWAMLIRARESPQGTKPPDRELIKQLNDQQLC
jgi:hypothetical protein